MSRNDVGLAAVFFVVLGLVSSLGAFARGIGAEPAPEAPVCRFLASVSNDAEIWRCSGAGFEASCYVSVSTGSMSKGASSIGELRLSRVAVTAPSFAA